MSAESVKPAVIVLSSHVARGAVGNRAIVFALEKLGFPVWAVPTVLLPWHPGHGRATRIVPEAAQFSDLLADLARSPRLGEVGAVLTGYFGDAGQIEAAARLVDSVKAANPAATYLCDPVCGDSGGLYVAQETATALRNEMVPRSDIITPNRFELAWLAGMPTETPQQAIAAAEALGRPLNAVTSAPALMAGSTGVLLVADGQRLAIEHRAIDRAPNGPGDLFSALFLGRILAGESREDALRKATASAFEALARASRRGADELMLAEDADCLAHPMAMVTLRRFAGPDRRA